jgi:hypothetical protein
MNSLKWTGHLTRGSSGETCLTHMEKELMKLGIDLGRAEG